MHALMLLLVAAAPEQLVYRVWEQRRVVEDLDINADCTMLRALRFVPGIDAEAYDPHR